MKKKDFLRLKGLVFEEKRRLSKKKKLKYGDYGFVSIPAFHSNKQGQDFARRLKQKIFSSWD